MRTLFVISALIFTACSDGAMQSDGMEEMDYAAAPPPPVTVTGSRMKRRDVAGGTGGEPMRAENFLAYRYGYSFALPSASVKSVVDAHAQRCIDAGSDKCQVLNTSVRDYDDDNVSANLSLRAEPEWLESYAVTLTETVDQADGRMTASSVSAEDLTRQILDVDARLSAQKTLRDRLTGLLETRDAELSDLLELERELARVQGEIESATSTLNALRQRVNMSIVNIDYSTKRSAVSGSAVAPVGDALKDFLRTLSQGLASVIRFIAGVLPWLIFVMIPVFFLFRWLWRRRPVRKKA